MRFRVTPNLQIAIDALVKKAGERPEGEYIEFLISEESDRTELGAYGELLHDAIQGNCAGSLAKTMSKRHGGSSIPF